MLAGDYLQQIRSMLDGAPQVSDRQYGQMNGVNGDELCALLNKLEVEMTREREEHIQAMFFIARHVRSAMNRGDFGPATASDLSWANDHLGDKDPSVCPHVLDDKRIAELQLSVEEARGHFGDAGIVEAAEELLEETKRARVQAFEALAILASTTITLRNLGWDDSSSYQSAWELLSKAGVKGFHEDTKGLRR